MDMKIGDWQRISVLGEGGFGEVSLWRHRYSNKAIAVKRCKKTQLTIKQRERWRNEVDMLKNVIKHPNIVSYEDLPNELEEGIENPCKLPLLPMEYCAKGNLRIMLHQPHNCSGLQEGDVRGVLLDMSEALLYLHNRDIVHRDLKPDNVVIKECSDKPTGVIYKLIDLGFAKEVDTTMSLVGTTDYAAPEILQGENYHISVDYWSFGILTYEIICGNKKYPFTLPNVPVIQRLGFLKQKKSNHICIYETAGRMHWSSTINQKCHISSWLKEAIELWLQKALEYDGNVRKNTNVLQELKNILNKPIVTIFCVYTLKFYHYEINNCVLVSTLKTWISRDTNVFPDDLIILTGEISSGPSDKELVINILPNEDTCIFVLNKCSFWNATAKLPTPDLVKFNVKTFDKTVAFSSTIFHLLTEKKHFSALEKALLFLGRYITWLFSDIYVQYERLYFLCYKMVTLIEFYNSVRKETKTDSMVSVVKQIIEKCKKLEKRLTKLRNYEQIALDKTKDLNIVLSQHVSELQNKCSVAEAKIKSAGEGKAGTTAFVIVSDAVKQRQTTLRCLQTEFKVVTFVMAESTKLKEWMDGIEKNVNGTIAYLRRIETQRNVQMCENGHLDCKKLIEINTSITSQLEHAISTGLSEFLKITADVEELLKTTTKD